ncbi:uncharacterized protein [Solanum tuberosum]|uniref:uncharacterized protein isoform X2 n=1 Tax=Solanum tuberosum TaxID=4113 RepID=UPI00073A019F|nr:PREDICTED: uncharacterized protein LOC107061614 isoform X2 [Solanum tuberosum]
MFALIFFLPNFHAISLFKSLRFSLTLMNIGWIFLNITFEYRNHNLDRIYHQMGKDTLRRKSIYLHIDHSRATIQDLRSVCLGTVSASIFNNGERYFGEQLRGSLYNNLWVNQLLRSLKPEKEESKIKPEVAFSVIAIENDRDSVTGNNTLLGS